MSHGLSKMTNIKNFKPRVWNQTKRKALYEALVEKFGPNSTWETKFRPGYGRDKEYLNFLSDAAGFLGANSGHAVETQISWALADRISQPRSLVWAVFNMVAAFDAGFIEEQNIKLFETLQKS